MRLMIQLILIMKIISNTCNTMLFCNYVLFILHLFLSTSCLSVLIGLLFLIAGDWTKMVDGGMRKLTSLYRRTIYICDILWDMWRLWYICDVCDIYVMLVIYMCCWWYIYDVGDVCYIYLLFVWMECKKQIKRLFSITLPSAMAMTLGKVTTWEHAWEHSLPSAKAIALSKHHRFTECHGPGTRQRSPVYRVSWQDTR